MIRLHGPYPLDLGLPQAAARRALAALAATRRGTGELPTPRAGRPPGLYLIVQDGKDRPALLGFWLVAGPSWLREGTLGAPERMVPYVEAVLDAATEAVWWRDLATTPTVGRSWRPLIVFEWPPSLAIRSALPPPGSVAPEALHAPEEADEGHWLVPGARAGSAGRPNRPPPRAAAPPSPIPPERSLLTIARAQLEHDASSHQGRYFLLWPDRFPEGAPVPLDEWVTVGSDAGPKAEVPREHGLGPPLELPGGGAGYPLSGWLTRSLDVWPVSPEHVLGGTLARRDVRSPLLAQFTVAVLLTVVVFAPTLALALAVRAVSSPEAVTAPSPVTPETQPAISVCSPDHDAFVKELRCQIAALANGGQPEVPVCTEEQAQSVNPDPSRDVDPATDDLQAAWCGLYDRERDGWTVHLGIGTDASAFNAAEFVASQACFNVLGKPDPYALPRSSGDGSRRLGNPTAFLDNAELQIPPLTTLVARLESACTDYRPRVEARVEGAIFATHVGLPDVAAAGEGGVLRKTLLDEAIREETTVDQRCLRDGAAAGPEVASLSGICGPDMPVLPSEKVAKVWKEVLGPPEAAADEDLPAGAPQRLGASVSERLGAIERYTTARFDGGPNPPESALWRCHLDLRAQRSSRVVKGAWETDLPIPGRYDVGAGAVREQLELDDLLSLVRGGAANFGECWGVVAERLARYVPAHPLLGAVDPAVAWSTEQQVCAQVCAGYYRIQRPSAGPWVTPGHDLATCLDERPVPPTFPPELGHGTLDRLVLPWHGKGARAEQGPTRSEICAFNLIAEDLLPKGEEPLLASGTDPVSWAGETSSGSRIAGSVEGGAALSAVNLSTYGRSRSLATCANVATQCLVSTFLDVTDPARRVEPKDRATRGCPAGTQDPNPLTRRIEAYQWPAVWEAAVAEIPSVPRQGPGARLSPWCEQIAPYLVPSGTLPEGQLDYPCARGVEEARARVARMVQRAASSGVQP